MPQACASGSLLQLRGLDRDELVALLSEARDAREPEPVHAAPGPVALCFFEPSTRTRLSFEVAARRLGLAVIALGDASSTSKGETIVDTCRTIEQMGIACLVLRARPSGMAQVVARSLSCPVVNAGDGRHEHPTQGLIDCLAIAEGLGRDDFDLSGVRVLIVGDIVNSRVARSSAAGLTTLGARVVCAGPPHLCPDALAGALGVEIARDFDAQLALADAVMMLRVQRERHGKPDGDSWGAAGDAGAYRLAWGLTRERMDLLQDHAVILHPGPVNRGVEIDPEVADAPRSLILRQVALGVQVRSAVFRRAVAPS